MPGLDVGSDRRRYEIKDYTSKNNLSDHLSLIFGTVGYLTSVATGMFPLKYNFCFSVLTHSMLETSPSHGCDPEWGWQNIPEIPEYLMSTWPHFNASYGNKIKQPQYKEVSSDSTLSHLKLNCNHCNCIMYEVVYRSDTSCHVPPPLTCMWGHDPVPCTVCACFCKLTLRPHIKWSKQTDSDHDSTWRYS